MKITRKQHKEGLQEIADGLFKVGEPPLQLTVTKFVNVRLPNKTLTSRSSTRLYPDAKLVRNKHGKGAMANLRSIKKLNK